MARLWCKSLATQSCTYSAWIAHGITSRGGLRFIAADVRDNFDVYPAFFKGGRKPFVNRIRKWKFDIAKFVYWGVEELALGQ